MPQVPYNPVPDNTPQFDATPNVRVNAGPDTFGGNIARAVEHLGTTTEAVGNEMFNRAIAMQQLRNESERTEAVADLEKQMGQAHIDFTSLEGKNAVDAQQKYYDQLDKIRTGIRDKLSNPYVQKTFDSQALGIQNRHIIMGAGYAASQNKKYSHDSSTSLMESLVDAARNAADDKTFNDIQNKIAVEARHVSQLAGHDPASTDQHVFTWQSKALANRIISTAHTNPQKAQQMFTDAMEAGASGDNKLHSQDIDRVDRAVSTAMHGAGARNINDTIQKTNADPDGYLAKRAGEVGARVPTINPNFTRQLSAALQEAERQTGEQAKIVGARSFERTREEQAAIRAENEAKPGGIAMHPAARPGFSQHERGEAVDLASGKVLDWLHKNSDYVAKEYGLTFLPGDVGAHDRGHLRFTTEKPNYQVPLAQQEAEARHMAEQQRPGDVYFSDRAANAVTSTYVQNQRIAREAYTRNMETINESLNTAGPSLSLEDLGGRSPEVRQAIDSLTQTQQKALAKSLAQGRKFSDSTEKARIEGMIHFPDQWTDFVKEDLDNNNKLTIADQQRFRNKQIEIEAKGQSDPKTAHAMSIVRTMVDKSFWNDTEKKNVMTGFMAQELKEHKERTLKDANDEEIRDIAKRVLNERNDNIFGAKRHVIEGQYTGFQPFAGPFGKPWWGPVTGGIGPEAQSLIGMEVPSVDKERIKNDPKWADKNLPPPNDEQIKTYYMLEKYKELYGKSEK